MAYHVWSGLSVIGGPTATGGTTEPGTPIVVLASKAATPRAANRKTGDMWQMYILPDGIMPTDAIASGEDAAVCGNCIHRKVNGGTCYTYGTGIVAANGMMRAHMAGRSKAFTPDMVAGDTVRLGSYGDPAAVPWRVWRPIIAAARGWTGYTHQWRNPAIAPEFRTACMASCDNEGEMALATARGWRTYTVLPVGTGRVPGAVPCPSPRIACEACLKCSGTGMGRRGNVTIEAHGTRARKFTGIAPGKSLPLSVA